MTRIERQEALAKVVKLTLQGKWFAYSLLVELGWEEDLIYLIIGE